MGIISDQIKERREKDEQMLEDAFVRAAGSVLGRKTAQDLHDDRQITENVIDEILRYYHLDSVHIPEDITDPDEQLSYALRQRGFMRRSIRLTPGWYRDAYGPVLAFMKDGGTPVALLPGKLGVFMFRDPSGGERVRVSRKNEDLFEEEAFCFYHPLPMRKIGIPDLLLFMKDCLSVRDIASIAVIAFVMTALGIVSTRIIRVLTGPVLASSNRSALAGAVICLVAIAVSSQLISSTRELLMNRLETKTRLAVESSMFMRILSLPTQFFRRYSPGELLSRASSVYSLCSLLQGMVMSTALTSVFSLLYIGQIYEYAPSLALPSFITILVTVAFTAVSTFTAIRVERQQMEAVARESGMTYATISGIQKIKLTGAEKRVFARWLEIHADSAALRYDPPFVIKLSSTVSSAISLVSGIVMCFLAVKSGVSQSSYYAFTAAYGALMGAFMSLASMTYSFASVRATLDVAEPFLLTEPEVTEGRQIVTKLSGGIRLEHVYFRYSEKSPYLLDDISLNISPGEYVAVTGKTGCGKSTLIRLLLGFETPEKGIISYDGKDITTLDVSSLRKHIGTVLQTGGLFQGDIYSNIAMTAPQMSEEEAWEAAETAGIADDIRAMPMGMHTMISEGQGGISGGQKQRLMIARAVAPKPKILFMDEATSALDNKTQRKVSEALDRMGCTRIVVAHRLSTIKHCDRILVLDNGKIIEDGSYDELIAKGGAFAELVARQRLEGE
ncbi:MAG: ATP-binding cassette domain-containing protein [Firmicutes bacterium]|nr:ATP-binding cassette domain-containing protein [Bacillota bacterium]